MIFFDNWFIRENSIVQVVGSVQTIECLTKKSPESFLYMSGAKSEMHDVVA